MKNEADKVIVIHQSNYIPWKGYFDLIHRADEFIILDEVQYTKNDWRNRNRIKTVQGVQWLTIPVKQIYLHQKINETAIASQTWQRKHWDTLKTNYAQSSYFKFYKDYFESLYLNCQSQLLSEINYRFIIAICEVLAIKTKITSSTEYILKADKNERLIYLIQQAKGTHYLSGKSAQAYLDVDLFAKAGITVEWMDYADYPTYTQLFPPFVHEVSILDLLFNEGENARNFMKSFHFK